MYLLFEDFEVDVQSGDQLQYHGAGDGGVGGPQEPPQGAVGGFGGGGHGLGVVVTGQQQAARGRGVQDRHDVGEGDRPPRGGGGERVDVQRPTGLQELQVGVDVLRDRQRKTSRASFHSHGRSHSSETATAIDHHTVTTYKRIKTEIKR